MYGTAIPYIDILLVWCSSSSSINGCCIHTFHQPLSLGPFLSLCALWKCAPIQMNYAVAVNLCRWCFQRSCPYSSFCGIQFAAVFSATHTHTNHKQYAWTLSIFTAQKWFHFVFNFLWICYHLDLNRLFQINVCVRYRFYGVSWKVSIFFVCHL